VTPYEKDGVTLHCGDCGGPIGQDTGPPDGWQLEDGRTVCHSCCCVDTRRIVVDLMQVLIEALRERHANENSGGVGND
jgi:hypothetical protein